MAAGRGAIWRRRRATGSAGGVSRRPERGRQEQSQSFTIEGDPIPLRSLTAEEEDESEDKDQIDLGEPTAVLPAVGLQRLLNSHLRTPMRHRAHLLVVLRFRAVPLFAQQPKGAMEGLRDEGGRRRRRAGAVDAGIAILKAGGNAADAAAATILALSVTDGNSFCFGGEVPILVYDAKRGVVEVLVRPRGGARGWRRASTSPRRGGIPGKGIEAAAVPGALDACLTLLDRYGTRTFAEAVAPTLAPARPRRARPGTPTWRRPSAGWSTPRRRPAATAAAACAWSPTTSTAARSPARSTPGAGRTAA